MLSYAFAEGKQWAETYSGWFNPTPQQHEDKKWQALSDAIKLVRP